MLRKTLTLGMVFVLALSLLAVSMITCFTYEAQAHDQWRCEKNGTVKIVNSPIAGWDCTWIDHDHEFVTGE